MENIPILIFIWIAFGGVITIYEIIFEIKPKNYILDFFKLPFTLFNKFMKLSDYEKNKSDWTWDGYDFDNPKKAKQFRYIVVYNGDRDLNGCYAFTNKRELAKFLEETK